MKRRSVAHRFLARFGLELFLVALVTILFSDYLFSDQLLYGSDSIPTGMFYRSLLVQFVRDYGQLPRWNPFILGGIPFLDAQHGDTFYPLSLLQYVMPVYRAMGHKLLINIVLAGTFMAFYLRTIRLSRAAVVFGAIAFALCPLFVSHLYTGQDGRSYVIALTPLAMALLERALSKGTIRSWVGLGLAISATVLSAQIQMAYHLLWYVGALFVFRLFFPLVPDSPVRKARALGGFAAAILLGLMVAAVQLFPAVAYVKHPAGFSVRSDRTDYAHATSWSLHAEELASMVVPAFCNAPKGYWGRNPFKYNSDYIGIGVVFLATLALFQRRNALRWFLFGISAFSVCYALGSHTPLHRVFYEIVPQVKLFRAPSLVLFGGAFGMCALAAHALHDWDSSTRSDDALARNVLFVGLAAAASLVLLGTVASSIISLWNSIFMGTLAEPQRSAQLANIPAFRTGAWTAAGLVAAFAVISSMRLRRKLSSRAGLVVLTLLAIIDLWRVDEPFKVLLPPEIFTRPDAFIAPIAEESRREKFRVMPVFDRYAQNELGYFGIESALGFHDNELAWYRRLRADPRAQGLLVKRNGSFPLLRMLNVKYVLHNSPDIPNPLPVPDYLPRFWVADEYQIATDPDEILDRMLNPDFDPEREVILEEDPGFASAAGLEVAGFVESYRYEANEVHIIVQASRPCLLLQSENWFPYWHAFRMAEEIPIYRADSVIRAIPMVEGRNEIELRFRSEPFEWGRLISIAALLAAFLAFAVPSVRQWRAER